MHVKGCPDPVAAIREAKCIRFADGRVCGLGYTAGNLTDAVHPECALQALADAKFIVLHQHSDRTAHKPRKQCAL